MEIKGRMANEFRKVSEFDAYSDEEDDAEKNCNDELLSHNFAFLP